jgi:flavin reductase (DIM6/NTAB) family NADH-FMN oxidoreductase RutF
MFYEPRHGHGLPHDPFKACVAPRPIGWISTVSREGIVNLAPFSYFNAVLDFPPTVMFSASGPHKDGALKDTSRNAIDTGEFVYNIATWDLREKMNLTSARRRLAHSTRMPHGSRARLADLEAGSGKPHRLWRSGGRAH